MKLIKLDAIDSTNDFLKALSSNQSLENFTVVTAQNQTKGKGQMGAVWQSETGKNLIMSVLIKDFLVDVNQIFDLNIVVSLAVIDVLNQKGILNLNIKWPNDIMADNKKIGGILIENTLKPDKTIQSVVGLGLNVNQTNYDNLPKASSLAVVCKTDFDTDEILFLIIEKLKENITIWNKNDSFLKSKYIDLLFKKGIPMPFSDTNNEKFMGIIQGITETGKLEILLENDLIANFDIKEITMLY